MKNAPLLPRSYFFLNVFVHYAIENGDMVYSSYCTHHIVTKIFNSCESLQQVSSYYNKYITNFLARNNKFIHTFALAITQPFQQLIGLNDFDEKTYILENSENSLLMAAYPYTKNFQIFPPIFSFLTINRYYCGKLSSSYIMDSLELEPLLNLATIAINLCPKVQIGTYEVVEVYLYCALAFLKASRATTQDDMKFKLIKQADELLVKLKVPPKNPLLK